MKPPSIISACLLGVVLILNSCSKQEVEKVRPNIILFYADDLDFDEISIYEGREFPCYSGMEELGLYRPDQDDTARSHYQNRRFLHEGEMVFYDDPRMYMPTIDKLADEGAVFDRFYVTTAICTPSRYSLITGRYASRSPGVIHFREPGNVTFNQHLLPTEGNFAREMKRLGYETGFVGKWHNGNGGVRVDRGTSNRIRGMDPEDPEAKEIYQGFYKGLARHLKDSIGFDFAERIWAGNKESQPVPQVMRVHNLEWLTEGALKFIRQDRENPFFLYMALTVPHGRYYSDWINDDPLATPAGMLSERPDCMPPREEIIGLLEEKGIDTRNAIATWIDFSVAALMEGLKEKELDENTVFIFISDHQSRGKNAAYEGCRVPMFVWWGDRIPPGTRIDEICANIDVSSTLVDMAGGQVSPGNPQDGMSFLPVILGKGKGDFRQALLLELGFSRSVVTKKYKYMANRPPESIALRMQEEEKEYNATGRRRRIDWAGSSNPHLPEPGIWFCADRDFPNYFDQDQLYDLEKDWFEQENILDTPEGQKVLPGLKMQLKDLMKDMEYPFGEFTP